MRSGKTPKYQRFHRGTAPFQPQKTENPGNQRNEIRPAPEKRVTILTHRKYAIPSHSFQRPLERDDISGECKATAPNLKNLTGLPEQQPLLNRAIENLERLADSFNPC
jgi:hypothetical protein